MIYEYAIDPELVAAWAKEQKDYRYFMEAFAFDSGRKLSIFPKDWHQQVKQAFLKSGPKKTGDQQRSEELRKMFMVKPIKREGTEWNEKQTWTDNALVEHTRYPFNAILARKNPAGHPDILDDSDLGNPECERWEASYQVVVKRIAKEMAEAIRPMLSVCRWVKFIDPHTWPGESRYADTFSAFMKILGNKRPIPLEFIEIHTKNQEDTSNDIVMSQFQKVIPQGMEATLYQWKRRSDEQRLHNRYILTNLGGVSFQHGLDKGSEKETDLVTRLSCEPYDVTLGDYDPQNPAFDPAGDPIKIMGTWKIS
jgi:hypothetical protein